MNRLAGALIAYVVLGVLTWATISDARIRAATLAILALFAVKSILRRKDVLRPDGESERNASEGSAWDGQDFSRAAKAPTDERL